MRADARLIAGRHEGGFVLVLTLWALVVLGVMLTTLSYQVRVEAALARTMRDASVLRWAARGAVHAAANEVRKHAYGERDTVPDNWQSDPEIYAEQRYGRVVVSVLARQQSAETDIDADADTDADADADEQKYGLVDEESRLNINTATPEQLNGFPGVSAVLAEAIVRHRTTLEPAEKRSAADSMAEDTAVELVQGPFASLRDLLSIDGVSESLLFDEHEDRPPLAELLTAVSTGKVNVNTASEEVLTAVGFNEPQVNTIIARRDDDAYENLSDVQAELFEGGDERWALLAESLSVRSRVFQVLASAAIADEASSGVSQRSGPRSHRIRATLFAAEQTLAFVSWNEY